MTVIAWDGRTLAADKCATRGTTRHKTTKLQRRQIERLGGECLLGGSGTFDIMLLLREWVAAGGKPEDFPDRAKSGDASLLVVTRKRELLLFESCHIPQRVLQPFFAIGSGKEFALGAMDVGADARKAVAVASKYDTGCGLGVDALRFL